MLEPEEFSDTMIKLGPHILPALNIQIADWDYYKTEHGHYFEVPYEDGQLTVLSQETRGALILAEVYENWQEVIIGVADLHSHVTSDFVFHFHNWEDYLEFHFMTSAPFTKDSVMDEDGDLTPTLLPKGH